MEKKEEKDISDGGARLTCKAVGGERPPRSSLAKRYNDLSPLRGESLVDPVPLRLALRGLDEEHVVRPNVPGHVDRGRMHE